MRNQVLTPLFMLLISVTIVGQNNWTMSSANQYHNAYNAVEDVLYPPFEISETLPVYGESMIKSDDILYTANGGDPNTITAYDLKSNTELWSYQMPNTKGSIGVVPAIYRQYILFSGQHAEGLYALNRMTGEELWVKPIGSLFNQNPLIDDAGNVYIHKDSLFYLDIQDGSTKWAFRTGGGYATPTMGDNIVYMSSNESIFAINKNTGEQVWKRAHSYGPNGHIMYEEGRIYFCHRTSIYAFNSITGSKQWYYELPDGYEIIGYAYGAATVTKNVVSTIAINNDNTLSKLITLNKNNGDFLWEYDTSGPWACPPTATNGFICITGGWNHRWIKTFDEMTGQLLYEESNRRYADQVIFDDGKLYAFSDAGLTVFTNASSSSDEISSEKIDIKLIPNPSQWSSTISYSVPYKMRMGIKLYDLSGKLLYSIYEGSCSKGAYSQEIKTGGLQPGIYLILLESDTRRSIRKLIVQR